MSAVAVFMSLLSESITMSTKIYIFLSNYFITYSIYICFYIFHNIVYQVNFLTCVTPEYFSRKSKESKDEVRLGSGSPGLRHGHCPWSRGSSSGKNVLLLILFLLKSCFLGWCWEPYRGPEEGGGLRPEQPLRGRGVPQQPCQSGELLPAASGWL